MTEVTHEFAEDRGVTTAAAAEARRMERVTCLLNGLPTEERTLLLQRLPAAHAREIRQHSRRSSSSNAACEVFRNFIAELTRRRRAQAMTLAAQRRYLSAIAPEQLAERLLDEGPQTVAAVLLLVTAQAAAKVVACFPKDQQRIVLNRLAATRPVAVRIQVAVADQLVRELQRQRETATADQQLAEIRRYLNAA